MKRTTIPIQPKDRLIDMAIHTALVTIAQRGQLAVATDTPLIITNEEYHLLRNVNTDAWDDACFAVFGSNINLGAVSVTVVW